MNKIVAPVTPESNADVIANLHAVLQLCLARRVTLANDDNRRQQLAAALSQEQAARKYGGATAKVIAAFQEEHHLQDNGKVDEATALALNRVLQELNALDPPAPPIEFVVSGHVRYADNTPAPNLTVRALQQLNGSVVKLGDDDTDGEGLYTIRYLPVAAAESITLNLLVLTADGQRLAESGAGPAGRLEARDVVLRADKPATYRVIGRVQTATNASVNGLDVEVIDKRVGGDGPVLEKTKTDENGIYALTFSSDKVLALKKTRPDLQARVLGNAQELGRSEVRYNASLNERLDVLLDEKAADRSEHDALTAALETHFSGGLDQLKENDQQQDITFLANKTGWDARAVALASLASEFSKQTAAKVSARHFYALFRAGLPADAQTLYRTDAATLERVWTQAGDQGVIPKGTANEIQAVVDQFGQVAAGQLLNDTVAGVSSLTSMLDVAGLDPQSKLKFAEEYASNRADPNKFWGNIGAALTAEAAKKLQSFGKLGFLTVNNADLMKKVGDLAGGSLIKEPALLASQLAGAGLYRSQAWMQLLTQEVQIPSEIPGADAAARRANYAEYLAAQVRLSEPSVAVAEMVKSGEVPLAPVGPAADSVHKFLTERRADFNIGVQPIRQYLAKKKLSLDEGTTRNLQRLQRVYQLTSSDTAMSGLLKRGVDAAKDIVRYDRSSFVKDFAADLGGDAAAASTHDRAVQIHNAVLNVIVSYLHARTAPPIGVHSPPAAIDPIPANTSDIIAGATLEKLFGSMDFCACSHCRSILSPSAYLVDLLMFLDHPSPPAGTKNPQDVLLARRPDIQYLPLTCENTNTALPYIDLVNETLEYYIANTVKPLSLDKYEGHDTGAAASEDLLASPQHVMDSAYATLQSETFPPTLPFHQPLEHLRRLCAKFEVSLPQVMETLRADDAVERANNASYGWRDIWMEELGLSRGEYSILTDSAAVPLQAMFGIQAATTEAAARTELANAKGLADRLKLSYYELLAILRSRFVNPAARLVSRLENLGVSFAVLKELKDNAAFDATFDGLIGSASTTTPDPAQYGGDIKKWVRDPANYSDIMSLLTLTVAAPTWAAGQAFQAGALVWPATAKPGSTMYSECTTGGVAANAEPAWPTQVGTTVSDGGVTWTARDAADCSSFRHLSLRYADPAQLGNEVASADYVRLLRFVRIWRKTGWTIEQTDAALCSLFTADMSSFERSDCDTAVKLDAGFLRLLPRLGQIKRVMTRMNLTVERDLLPLLTCFAPMTTFECPQWQPNEKEGYSRVVQPSLYRQLFLNPVLLAQDAVFDDKGYGQFLTAPAFLTVHAEAIRTACNLTADEYDRIIAALAFDGTTALSVANLSAIYRRGWLARKMRLSVRELLLLMQLTGLDPFVDDAAMQPAMLRLLDLLEALQARSLSVAAATYLIWNQDLSGRSQPSDEQVTSLARELRLGFASIETALAITDDPDGGAVQNRLALVYGNDTATLLMGMLNGSFSFSTPYADEEGHFSSGGAGPAIVAAAGKDEADAPRLRFDDFAKQLSFVGVLTQILADALKAAAGAAPKFGGAIDKLLIANKAASQPLFEQYPELRTAFDSYVADTANEPAKKRGALLEALLPELIARRKRQQAMQMVSASVGAGPALALALLDATNAPYPLHASGVSARPALDDILGVETGGLSVKFFAGPNIGGAPIVAPDVAAVVDYAKSPSTPLPQNGGAVISGIWSGWLEAPETGLFNVRSEADVGATVKLALDGDDVPLNQNGALRVNGAPLSLQAGSLYRIELKVENVKDTLRLQWEWQPKGQGRTTVPSRLLYPATAFAAFAATYRRFLKAASLAAGLDISASELSWLATSAALRIDATGKLNAAGDDWLNLLPSNDSLKLTGPEAAIAKQLNASLLAPLRSLLTFSRMKAELADQDETLLQVLEDLMTGSNVDGALYRVTRWSRSSFIDSVARFQGSIATLDLSTFQRVYDAMELERKMGASARTLIQVTTNEPSGDQVRTLQAALRARYDAAAWRDLIKPVNDELRSIQRDALVAYTLRRMPPGIDTPNKLFEYFLMDVEMAPCMETSRIRHALSSVQLFIERCLMNLETSVAPSVLSPTQWAWMKRYRVWEANRKVYLYPENWLETELRDDKSPFFKEIESELLQSDITDERAEIAMLNYLSRLEEVAKLEPCGVHYIPGDPVGGRNELTYVVARTAGAHRKYFCRRLEDGCWTGWEQIKLEIEDNPVVPVVWRNRLFLFWLRVFQRLPDRVVRSAPAWLVESANFQGFAAAETSLKLGGDNSSSKPVAELNVNQVSNATADQSAKATEVSFRVVLCWSEYFNGKWQATKTSDVDNPVTLLEGQVSSFDRTRLKLFAQPSESGLRVDVVHDSSLASFMLHNAYSRPEIIGSAGRFSPPRSIELATSDLRVFYSGPGDPSTVLHNPLTDVAAQPNHPVTGSAWMPPFFYADSRHAYQVTTAQELVWIADWTGFGVDPSPKSWVPKIPPLVKVPLDIVPDPIGPVVQQSRFGLVDPVPVERFVTQDAYISHALGTPGTVSFGGKEIGPMGSTLRSLRTR